MKFYRYGHLLEVSVKVGDKVKKGQKIGTNGTGNGQWSAHCHFDCPTEKLAAWTNYVFGMSKEAVKNLYADPNSLIETVYPEFDHFGWRYLEWADYGSKKCYHPGVDLNGPGAGNADLGDLICSASDGIVEYVYNGTGTNGGWGKLIVIKEVIEDPIVVSDPLDPNSNESVVNNNNSNTISENNATLPSSNNNPAGGNISSGSQKKEKNFFQALSDFFAKMVESLANLWKK